VQELIRWMRYEAPFYENATLLAEGCLAQFRNRNNDEEAVFEWAQKIFYDEGRGHTE